jgi:hypothetical protein
LLRQFVQFFFEVAKGVAAGMNGKESLVLVQVVIGVGLFLLDDEKDVVSRFGE